MRALVIDDEPMVCGWAHKVLGEAGISTDTAFTADEGRAKALSVPYDLVIVDLDLEDRSGLSVIYALRRAGRTCPIMIMTSNGSDEVLVSGLDAGADDYLVKPVSNAVLRARVRAAIRRGGATTSETVRLGNVTLDRVTQRVRVGEQEMHLTAREFQLLSHLVSRPEEIVGRADLLERVWQMRFDTRTNVVEATVSRLRRKLKESGSTAVLDAVRGRGYVLRSESVVPRDA